MYSTTYRRLATFSYCLALFLGGLCVNIIGPAGPLLTRSLHASGGMIGNIFTAEGAGNTLGSSMLGALLQRYSGHTVVGTLCFVLFFAVGLIPACTSLVQVVGLYVIIGGCLGLNNGAANTLVTWVHKGHNVGPWVNLINSSMGLGASSAPLLFVVVERRFGNGLAAFSAIGAFATVPALVATFLPSPAPPPPKLLQHDGNEDSAHHPLRGLGMGHGTSSVFGVDLGSRAAYVRVTVIAPLLAVLTLVVGAEIAYAGWVYSYAIERVGMRPAEAACLNSLFWSTFTVGRLCTIPLAAYLTPGALLVPTMAIEVGSLLLIAAQPGSVRALWVGTAGAGIGVCALYSNLLSLLASYDLITPNTMSSLSMASALGHMSIPNLVGVAIHSGGMGFDALIWIVTVAHAIGLVLITAVVVHLRRNFEPSADSLLGRRLRARRYEAAKSSTVEL